MDRFCTQFYLIFKLKKTTTNQFDFQKSSFKCKLNRHWQQFTYSIKVVSLNVYHLMFVKLYI